MGAIILMLLALAASSDVVIVAVAMSASARTSGIATRFNGAMVFGITSFLMTCLGTIIASYPLSSAALGVQLATSALLATVGLRAIRDGLEAKIGGLHDEAVDRDGGLAYLISMAIVANVDCLAIGTSYQIMETNQRSLAVVNGCGATIAFTMGMVLGSKLRCLEHGNAGCASGFLLIVVSVLGLGF